MLQSILCDILKIITITIGYCYDLPQSIKQISGNFIKGQLNGKTSIIYKDETRMEATFSNGFISGIVHIYNRHDQLQAMGLYKEGLPHGPWWAFGDLGQFVQVHFNKGHVVKENVIYANYEDESAMIGNYWVHHYKLYFIIHKVNFPEIS